MPGVVLRQHVDFGDETELYYRPSGHNVMVIADAEILTV